MGPRRRSREGRYCVTPFKSTTNSRDVPRYSAASRPDTAYDWADGDNRLRRIFRVAAPSNDGPLTDHIADLLARWAVAAAHAPYRTLSSSTRLRAELRHSKVRCERAGTVNDPEVGNRLRRDIDRVGVELVSFGANTAEQPQQISITGKLGTPGNDPGDLPLPASSGACVGSPCPPPAAAARRGCAFKFGEVRRGVDDCGMGEGLREIP